MHYRSCSNSDSVGERADQHDTAKDSCTSDFLEIRKLYPHECNFLDSSKGGDSTIILIQTTNVSRNLSLEGAEIGTKSYRGSCSDTWCITKMKDLKNLLLSSYAHLKLRYQVIV